MKTNTIYNENNYRKANKYLRLVRSGMHHGELVTPDVIYKLSLMALDKLTLSFLSFYEVVPANLGTVALLNEVQKVVYIDDAVIERLKKIINQQDQNIKENKERAVGIERPQAITVLAYVRKIHRVIAPYLPDV